MDIENIPAPDLEPIVEQFGDLMQKCLDQTGLFKRMFFDGDEIDIWMDRYRDRGTPIRALAIKWHRSRFKIRKTLSRVERKLLAIRQLLNS